MITRPASRGAFLSEYEKSHHETVMAKFNFTAYFARPPLTVFFGKYKYRGEIFLKENFSPIPPFKRTIQGGNEKSHSAFDYCKHKRYYCSIRSRTRPKGWRKEGSQ